MAWQISKLHTAAVISEIYLCHFPNRWASGSAGGRRDLRSFNRALETDGSPYLRILAICSSFFSHLAPTNERENC